MKNSLNLSLREYDRQCLDKSWDWLNDPETKKLTMAPDFSRDEQLIFFDNLKNRSDYLIWSIWYSNQEVIGAAGLKNHRGTMAEYWCYIGEKKYWNMGLGREIISLIEEKARLCGFSELDIVVSKENTRSVVVHEKCGYVVNDISSTKDCFHLIKQNI